MANINKVIDDFIMGVGNNMPPLKQKIKNVMVQILYFLWFDFCFALLQIMIMNLRQKKIKFKQV